MHTKLEDLRARRAKLEATREELQRERHDLVRAQEEKAAERGRQREAHRAAREKLKAGEGGPETAAEALAAEARAEGLAEDVEALDAQLADLDARLAKVEAMISADQEREDLAEIARTVAAAYERVQAARRAAYEAAAEAKRVLGEEYERCGPLRREFVARAHKILPFQDHTLHPAAGGGGAPPEGPACLAFLGEIEVRAGVGVGPLAYHWSRGGQFAGREDGLRWSRLEPETFPDPYLRDELDTLLRVVM